MTYSITYKMEITQAWYKMGIFEGKTKKPILNRQPGSQGFLIPYVVSPQHREKPNKVKGDKTQQNLRNNRKRNNPRN